MSASVCKFKSAKCSNDFEDDDLTYKNGYRQWTKQNQRYDGTFLGRVIHGDGTYKWNKHAVYEGSFYANMKQGYALVSLANNSCFEGLFVNNKPFGPGVYTYSNGRQDVGYWVDRKLVRLSRPVDFIIPRLAATPSAKIKLLQCRRPIPLNEDTSRSVTDILSTCNYTLQPGNASPYSRQVNDPRSFVFDWPTFEHAYFLNAQASTADSVFSDTVVDLSKSLDIDEDEEEEPEVWIPEHCLCQTDGFQIVNKTTDGPMDGEDICCEKHGEHEDLGPLGYYSKFGTLKKFFDNENDSSDIVINQDEEEEVMDEEDGKTYSEELITSNRNDLRVEMLRQIYRYRAFEGQVNFKIAKLMSGKRTAFRQTGEQEKQCLQFLKLCSMGPAYKIKSFLCDYEISQDLMDSRGNNSLMFAAASDQQDIIDILLDYGVDVNAFNDEGLTPLNLCLLRRLAEDNGITNWEKAFLPPEVNGFSGNFQTEEWRQGVSIESLDRIFGDGMSLEDIDHAVYEKTKEKEQEADNRSEKLLNLDVNVLSSCEFTVVNVKNLLKSTDSTIPIQNEAHPSERSADSSKTPKILERIVPKSFRREEFLKSVANTTEDKYMFDLTLKNSQLDNPIKPTKTRSTNHWKSYASVKLTLTEDSRESIMNQEEKVDSDLVNKLKEIDETIEKLLIRGADPNLSEVPKPAIHLGVFTKNPDIAKMLLGHGANPNQQLYSSEGRLTPLHVLALSKPAPEYVDICEVLLNHGANTEKETTPEFCMYEGEIIPDSLQGRTPLQLLCMRPDMENGDPQGYLKRKALLLAKVSNKNHFFNGHSILTLSMISGNYDLLQALLDSKYFDPNEVLGQDLGTSLYVLLSTEFQTKTILQDSLRVCNMLIQAGADPLKEFKSPKKLIGTCVDYGHREIEKEMEAREFKSQRKKEVKLGTSEKSAKRDHLGDHIKIVEYVERIASEMYRSRTGNANPKTTPSERRKRGSRSDHKEGRDRGRISEQKERSEGGGRDFDEDGRSTLDQQGRESRDRGSYAEQNEIKNRGSRVEQNEVKNRGSRVEQNEVQNRGSRVEQNEVQNRGSRVEQNEVKIRGSRTEQNEIKNRGSRTEQNEIKNRGSRAENIELKDRGSKRDKKDRGSIPHEREEFDRRIRQDSQGEDNKKPSKDTLQDNKAHRKNLLKETADEQNTKRGEKNKKDKKDESNANQKSKKPEIAGKPSETRSKEVYIDKHDSKTSRNRDEQCPNENSIASLKAFQANRYKSLLEAFGKPDDYDLNELILPYIVLRDGNFYYRFSGKKPLKKEQYSLI